MAKRVIVVGSIIVFVAAVIGLMLWRSHIMGPGARVSAGGLVAVSSNGTPIPVPIAQAGQGPVSENPAVQVAGNLQVSLGLDPYPPSVTKPGEFDVTLADVSGQAINDATISLDLTMPGMYMPPNQVTLQSLGAGKYRATGRFTMRGPWRIEVIITIAGKTQSVFFDVWL
jgi:hypothetical protein